MYAAFAWKHCALGSVEPNAPCPSLHATDTVCISSAWHSGGLRALAGNTCNAPCAKMDINGMGATGVGCQSTMNNWQPYALQKTSRHQPEGVEQKQHKYKFGTTLSAPLPDRTPRNHPHPFISRFLVVRVSPPSGTAPTRCPLLTYRVERCRSAPVARRGGTGITPLGGRMVMCALWYHHFLRRHSRAGSRWLSLRNMWPTPPLALGRHPATGYPHMPLQPGTARHCRSRHFGGRGASHPCPADSPAGIASAHTSATQPTQQRRPQWVVRTRASQWPCSN